MAEKISIITITYNSENSIEKTMLSVLSQNYRPLEYVLIDGASTDQTNNIIKKYIPEFRNRGIEVVYQSEPDKGISDAFNKGIERASGDIIGIINSDDEIAEDVLGKVAESFLENIGVVCGDCLWVDEAHGLKYIRKSKINQLYKIKYEMVLMHPTCFVRKSVYEEYGTFDVNLKLVMDKDLMARFYYKKVKFAYIPNIISIMTAGGVSDSNAKRVFEEGKIVALRYGATLWYVDLRFKYKEIRMKLIQKLRKVCSLAKK